MIFFLLLFFPLNKTKAQQNPQTYKLQASCRGCNEVSWHPAAGLHFCKACLQLQPAVALWHDVLVPGVWDNVGIAGPAIPAAAKGCGSGMAGDELGILLGKKPSVGFNRAAGLQ